VSVGRARAALAVLLACWAAGCGGCDDAPRARDAGRRVTKAANAGKAGETSAKNTILAEAEFLEVEGGVRWDRSGRIPNRLARVDAGAANLADTPPTVGDELRIGDAVEVGETGHVVLRLPEQGQVALGTEARLVVSPFAMNELGLQRGRLHASLDAPGQGRRSLKIATPGAYLLVQGREVLVGAGDDGSLRVCALSGVVTVHAASGKTDVPQGRALEVDAAGRAGAPVPAPPESEAMASMDGWMQGRRELVRRGAGAAAAALTKQVAAEIDAAPGEFEKVAKARERNRELLRGLREERRAGKAPGATADAARRELAEASEALVGQTDTARALWARIHGRFDLARRLAPEVGPQSGHDATAEALAALTPRVETLRQEALRLFRRSPRRPRPEIRGAVRRGPAGETAVEAVTAPGENR